VARLFDPARDPDGPVLESDWHSPTYAGLEGWQEWMELDGNNTVAAMRELYLMPDRPSPLRRARPW
jgi:hypothetical protein